jgi:4-hydroxybenzoate polyprenyltransferase
VLRGVRWSSLAVVLGAGALTLVCLVLALRGRPWAWVVALVCAATAVREVRALQRLDRRARAARRPRA